MNLDGVESKTLENAYIESTLLGIQELKNNLVTQIAHNFRTPLTSVIGFAEMLIDDQPLTDEQRIEYARFIQYEGIRLSKLIDDVLALSCLERGDYQLKMQNHDLREVVAEAILNVSEFAQRRFVTIKKCFTSLPVIVRADQKKIVQATYQLLHNAIRFTGPENEVSVTVKGVGTSAIIGVQDTGPGIPEEEIAMLLHPNDAAHRAEQDSRCTGIGLAIVRHIMDLHKGRIEVRSKVGEGSLFTLKIPGFQE